MFWRRLTFLIFEVFEAFWRVFKGLFGGFCMVFGAFQWLCIFLMVWIATLRGFTRVYLFSPPVAKAKHVDPQNDGFRVWSVLNSPPQKTLPQKKPQKTSFSGVPKKHRSCRHDFYWVLPRGFKAEQILGNDFALGRVPKQARYGGGRSSSDGISQRVSGKSSLVDLSLKGEDVFFGVHV